MRHRSYRTRTVSHSCRAFTLVELLIVIGILGVLMIILIVALDPAARFREARQTTRRSDVRTLDQAVRQRVVASQGQVPTSIPHYLSVTLAPIAKTGADICSDVVPDMIAKLPIDPEVAYTSTGITDCASAYNTGYSVVRDDAGQIVTLALTGSPPLRYGRVTARPGPVLWLKMDESAWTGDCVAWTMTDSSAMGNPARVCPAGVGPSPSSLGKLAGAGRFDGVNDYALVEDSSSLDQLSGSVGMTVMAWVRPGQSYGSGMPSDWYYIITRSGGPQYELGPQGFTDQLAWKPYNSTSTPYEVDATYPLVSGTWYHVAGVVQGTFVGLYVNGTLVASRNDFVGPINTGWRTYIGGNTTTRYINATIDDIRVYPYGRSQYEILDDMSQWGE